MKIYIQKLIQYYLGKKSPTSSQILLYLSLQKSV